MRDLLAYSVLIAYYRQILEKEETEYSPICPLMDNLFFADVGFFGTDFTHLQDAIKVRLMDDDFLFPVNVKGAQNRLSFLIGLLRNQLEVRAYANKDDANPFLGVPLNFFFTDRNHPYLTITSQEAYQELCYHIHDEAQSFFGLGMLGEKGAYEKACVLNRWWTLLNSCVK